VRTRPQLPALLVVRPSRKARGPSAEGSARVYRRKLRSGPWRSGFGLVNAQPGSSRRSTRSKAGHSGCELPLRRWRTAVAITADFHLHRRPGKAAHREREECVFDSASGTLRTKLRSATQEEARSFCRDGVLRRPRLKRTWPSSITTPLVPEKELWSHVRAGVDPFSFRSVRTSHQSEQPNPTTVG
jgi:hypothetical protein